MLAVGGSLNVVNAIAGAGGEPGPRTFWIGSWVLKSGWGGLEDFYASCKRLNHQPLVHLWTFGDALATPGRTMDDVLVGGVMDPHQDVWMDWEIARAMARQVAARAKAAGVTPIVTVESEFTKAGAESSVKMQDFLWDLTNTMRKEHPAIKLVFAPGLWADATRIGTWYMDVARSMDYLGVQLVKFPPRHGDYTDSANQIVSKLQEYRSIIGSMPTCVHDIHLSTYAGGEKAAPFEGGDPRAFDQEQATTIASLAALADAGIGLEFVIYRDLKDNPTFALSNYGGHAERHAGVIRADRVHKPAYEALLALARPIAVERTYTEDEMQALRDRLADAVESARAAQVLADEKVMEARALRARITALQEAWRDITEAP